MNISFVNWERIFFIKKVLKGWRIVRINNSEALSWRRLILLMICFPSATFIYILVCHSYFTRMHYYVICMSFVCTRMSFACHSYVTRMYSYVICMSLVCGFIVNQSYFLASKNKRNKCNNMVKHVKKAYFQKV